jgi:nucleoside-diphosphate-sugar epimerase
MTASNPIGTILRLPMVYGVNDPLHRFFPYLKRMDEGRRVIVLEEQMAHWQGTYGYVENVAQAIALAVTNAKAARRIYNVAEQTAQSQAAFIRAIGQAAGWTGQVVVVPRSALPESWVLPFNVSQDWTINSTRIRQELGYTEAFSRQEAFKQTVEWQRSHPPQTGSLDAPELLDYTTEDQTLETLAHR